MSLPWLGEVDTDQLDELARKGDNEFPFAPLPKIPFQKSAGKRCKNCHESLSKDHDTSKCKPCTDLWTCVTFYHAGHHDEISNNAHAKKERAKALKYFTTKRNEFKKARKAKAKSQELAKQEAAKAEKELCKEDILTMSKFLKEYKKADDAVERAEKLRNQTEKVRVELARITQQRKESRKDNVSFRGKYKSKSKTDSELRSVSPTSSESGVCAISPLQADPIDLFYSPLPTISSVTIPTFGEIASRRAEVQRRKVNLSWLIGKKRAELEELKAFQIDLTPKRKRSKLRHSLTGDLRMHYHHMPSLLK